jgi:diguanylate cyclase (GGDEF)-like protein
VTAIAHETYDSQSDINMMKRFFRIFSSSSSTAPSRRGKLNFLRRLVKPMMTITGDAERRQARLVSAFLLVTAVFVSIGILNVSFILRDLNRARILAFLALFSGITYILSRTRHYIIAMPLQLAIMVVWPVLSILWGKDYSSLSLLIFLMFGVLTLLISSALASYRMTISVAATNILLPLLLPIFISGIQYKDLIVPLIFNGVGAAIILILTQHRNLVEKDRLLVLSKLNIQLQTELTERKRAEEQMAYSATHDSLTDLPNRVLFMDRLQHTMERARRHKDYMYAVLFLDLDRFKVVNDSLGHTVGDQLLIETAARLTACLRNEDTVARLGGDEFVILLEDIQNTTEVTRVAKRIQQDLSLPYDLEGHKVFVFVSIGIVLTVDSYERTEDILRDADIAMYRAKGRGLGGYEIFDPEMLEHVMTRLELETQLRKALEHEELVVHYQPILDLWTDRIVGFEALVRWQHPTRGLMSPAEFIPTAEETGLIVPLGYWVLEKACRQIRIWQVQFPADPPLTISVNWSTRQCAESDLAEKIAEVLQETGLDAHTLNLELTESLLMDDTESTITRLSELRALGVQVQIHDFGTGYSSLGYPHTLPIDTLKIDRSFISRLEFNNNGSDIVRMILTLAHDLGMKVVAEGVETDDQLSKLKELDCEYVQGFLFAEPVNSQEAGALLGKAFNGIEDQKDGINGN